MSDLREALEPCPFCGEMDFSFVKQDNAGTVFVLCEECFARSGAGHGAHHATEIWNTRAALAQPQGDGEAVAWLDIREEPAADWTKRSVATNPDYVKANGCENFVPLYTAPPTDSRIRRALKKLKAMTPRDFKAYHDCIDEALRAGDNHASDGKSDLMQTAERASETVAGWSQSKQEYAKRATASDGKESEPLGRSDGSMPQGAAPDDGQNVVAVGLPKGPATATNHASDGKESEGGEPVVERTQRQLAVSDDGLGPMQIIPRNPPSGPSEHIPSDDLDAPLERTRGDERFSKLAPDQKAVFPEGFSAPFETRTTVEMMVDAARKPALDDLSRLKTEAANRKAIAEILACAHSPEALTAYRAGAGLAVEYWDKMADGVLAARLGYVLVRGDREAIARIIAPDTFAKFDAELAKGRRAENGRCWAELLYSDVINSAYEKANIILALQPRAGG